jgi:hypothetical protein
LLEAEGKRVIAYSWGRPGDDGSKTIEGEAGPSGGE